MPATGPKRDLDARERILRATRELICANGPNQVGINDIARDACVGKQTIYRWWPTRNAVVIDALEQCFQTESPHPDSGSTHDDIRTQLRRVTRTFASPIGSIIRELVAGAQGDPTIAEQFRTRFFAQRRIRARTVIERGIERGDLRHDLDVDTVIDLLYAPLWLRLLIGHRPLTRAAADQILEQIWPAIIRPSRPPGAEPLASEQSSLRLPPRPRACLLE